MKTMRDFNIGMHSGIDVGLLMAIEIGQELACSSSGAYRDGVVEYLDKIYEVYENAPPLKDEDYE